MTNFDPSSVDPSIKYPDMSADQPSTKQDKSDEPSTEDRTSTVAKDSLPKEKETESETLSERAIGPISEGPKENVPESSDKTTAISKSIISEGEPVMKEDPLLALQSQQAPHKIAPNLSEYGLNSEELNSIENYINENLSKLEQTAGDKPVHIRKNSVDPPLPRSLVFMPSGPKKGCYILLKTKEGVDEIGLGSFNRATKALHLESGEVKVFRTAKEEHVEENEMAANEKISKVDSRGEYFVTGTPVKYTGTWRTREREDEEDEEIPKESLPREENVSKVGMVLDYMKGGELVEHIEGQLIGEDEDTMPLSKEMVDIAMHIGKGLAISHEIGLVNIDNKADNIFMDGNTPKMGDFGWTYEVGHKLTTPKGSPGYVPPEIFMASESKPCILTPASEIWSYGVILSFSLKDTNFLLNNGEMDGDWSTITNRNKFNQFLTSCFPERNTPGTLDNILARCLDYDPDKRPTASQVVEMLEEYKKTIT